MSESTSISDDKSPGVRPKRVGKACDACYKRKIKCDPVFPSCNWCHHHNVSCTFTRDGRRSKRLKTQPPHDRQLSQRVDRLEKIVVESFPSGKGGSSVNSSPPGLEPTRDDGLRTEEQVVTHGSDSSGGLTNGQAVPSTGICFGKLHFAGLRLGDVSSCNGVPLFSAEGVQWVQSRTGDDVDLETLCSFGLPWQSRGPQQSDRLVREVALSGTIELPDLNLVKDFVSRFTDSTIRRIFPFIDPVLFEGTIRQAYHLSGGSQEGITSAKACVCSFVAVASTLNFCDEPAPSVDSEVYAFKAQCLLPQICTETTIDGLQTSLMLLVFHLVSGNLKQAIFLNTLVAGFIFMLGAHTRSRAESPQQSPSYPEIQRRHDRHLRTLFWVCYPLDKELSLRTRQPPAINDEHCDLTLPPEYERHLYSDYPARIIREGSLSEYSFPGDLRLSKIKSKTYSMLYSVRALQKSDTEIIKAIRELDDELETWRASLPWKNRPPVFCEKEPDPISEMNMRAVMIRLDYHHCMAIIHQACGRCTAWAGHQSGATDGVSSSLTMSVSASRSSLLYLQAAYHVLESHCFWLVIFYPMSSVLTLFCNILLYPLEQQSVGDLELLNSVPALIRGIPTRQLTANEVMHIKGIDHFVAELGRLAKCASFKARGGGRLKG